MVVVRYIGNGILHKKTLSQWGGHVWDEENKKCIQLFVGKSLGKQSSGRPRAR